MTNEVPWYLARSQGTISKMAPDQGSDFKMIDSSVDWGGHITLFEILIVPVDGLAPIGARTSAGTLLTNLCVYTRPGTWRQAWYQHAIIMVEINDWLSMMPNGHVLLATLLGPTAHAVRFSPTEFGQAALWRHQMETFSALLAICAGNSPVSGEFPAQRPVTRSFDVFFDVRLIKRLSKHSRGWWFETLSHPLWRHRNGACGFGFD